MIETARRVSASTTRDRTTVALAGVAVAFAIINSSLQALLSNESNNWVDALCLGILVAQPLVVGVWTALGSGSILTRLPIALPCLMLLFVAPGYVPDAFADLQRRDFIAAALTGFVIFAIAAALFLILRRFSGFRLQSFADLQHRNRDIRCRFDTKYLLALMTVYGVALGMTLRLQFQTGPSTSFFGPDFFIHVLIRVGAISTIVLLPILAIPLLILYGHPSRHSVWWLVVLWATVTLAVTGFLMGMGTSADESISAVVFLLVAQFGAAFISAIAAICLRFAGMRLVRYG